MLEYMCYLEIKPTLMPQDNQASFALNIRSRVRSMHMLALGALGTQEINHDTVVPIYTESKNNFVDMITK